MADAICDAVEQGCDVCFLDLHGAMVTEEMAEWMRKLHPHRESYLVGHSARCAVLALVVARDMGLAEAQLERAAKGALLCQIGKAKLPVRLLEKLGPLEEAELDRIREHVKLALEILDQKTGPTSSRR